MKLFVLGLICFHCVFAGTAGSSIDCDFESLNLCGYQQSHDDQLDWTRHLGNTQSSNTGPDDDHTLHNTHGYYMYIEASAPARSGNTAKLVSPTLSTGYPTTCLSFWFNMYGAGMGSLTVNTARVVDPSHVTPVWSRSGDEGQGWHYTNVTLDTSQPIKVIFEGTVGSSYYSDMAIDDVSATSGSCDPSGTAGSTTVASGNAGGSLADCDFEQGDLCGYMQLPSTGEPHDQMDWTLNQGHTGTAHTGPDDDHTLHNGNGHYIYVKSSSGSSGNLATIYSPVIHTTSSLSCLTFWYSMFGNNMGTLNVYTTTPHFQNIQTAWTLSGNKGPGWKMANITIDTSHPLEVIFNSVRGSGSQSDVALDDITLTHGACGQIVTTVTPAAQTTTATTTKASTTTKGTTASVSVSPTGGGSEADCNFEQGTVCSYTQFTSPRDDLDWTVHQGPTHTGYTGPDNDHTLDNPNGHYIYMNASTHPPGDKAIMVSPAIHTSVAESCFKFWYSMYGANMGMLQVLTATPHLRNIKTVWKINGDQGQGWNMANITVNTSQPVEIVFFGTIGIGTHSDIALDDITLTDGPCKPPIPSPADCDFEQGLCGYQQLPETGTTHDEMDWTLQQGPTSTGLTGPNNDHTLGNSNGHYIYMEASDRYFSNKATLISPPITGDSAQSCLTFWYSMYGSTMGELNVFTATPHLQHIQTVLTITGDQGQGWNVAQVTIDTSHTVEIIFNGVRGSSIYSDIALDDVKFVCLP